MALPMESPISFANVGESRWWQRGIFASQTGYVAIALLVLLIWGFAGLGTALIVGLVNGFCIAVLGLSPFVTTLGMLSIVRGLGYVVSNGRGSFPGGPDADYFYALTSGDLFGVPAPFLYLVILALVMAVVLHHCLFGRHVFALGGKSE